LIIHSFYHWQEAAYDAELQSGLEAQKKLREQILRRKEMRREMQMQVHRKDLTQQQQQQQQPITAPGSFLILSFFNLLTLLTLTFNIVFQKIAEQGKIKNFVPSFHWPFIRLQSVLVVVMGRRQLNIYFFCCSKMRSRTPALL